MRETPARSTSADTDGPRRCVCWSTRTLRPDSLPPDRSASKRDCICWVVGFFVLPTLSMDPPYLRPGEYWPSVKPYRPETACWFATHRDNEQTLRHWYVAPCFCASIVRQRPRKHLRRNGCHSWKWSRARDLLVTTRSPNLPDHSSSDVARRDPNSIFRSDVRNRFALLTTSGPNQQPPSSMRESCWLQVQRPWLPKFST